MGTIVFRAEASRQVGHGHVVRCLALADSFRARGAECLFVSSSAGALLADEVARRGHRHLTLDAADVAPERDAANTLAAVGRQLPVSAFVVDHYALDQAWETTIRRSGAPLLVIDDLARHHDCNFLLDQNLIGDGNPYAHGLPPECRCFLGPRYALLRPEFAVLRASAPIRRTLNRILIFFGGSDPGNETAKALHGVLASGNWRIDVVIGAGNPNRGAVEALVSGHPDRTRLHVQTPLMAELMAGSDLCIGAGGSASWERCSLRLPMIISVLAQNQAEIAERLHRIGAAVSLGEANALTAEDYGAAVSTIDGEHLSALSESAGRLVDGLGAQRLAAELEPYFGRTQ